MHCTRAAAALPGRSAGVGQLGDASGQILEETLGDREELSPHHLGLARFGAMLDRLGEVGAVDEATEVVAVHLGHHNPAPDELDRCLAARGARAGDDGEVVTLRPRVPGPG